MTIASPDGHIQARIREKDSRSLGRGVFLFAVHAALYLATLLGAIANFDLPVNTLFGAANGMFIALLFIIGHDANHGSFVPDPRWNRWFARVAFVPCVHAASLWRRTHNEMHHQRTNLKGVDHVWAPMSKAEYDAASPARRWLERVYRGPFGPLIYYYWTFWLYRMVLPLAPETRTQWKRHLPDSIFVLSAFAVTLIAIGVADKRMCSSHRGNVLSTVHVKLPRYIAPLYSDALAHTAHHADMLLPVYGLPAAQAKLKSAYGKAVQEYTLSLTEYRKIYSVCKLFDFERMCWTDFEGRPTAVTWAANSAIKA
jgi:omega-6 fatty acid desaturase (delta-12 desaturase)